MKICQRIKKCPRLEKILLFCKKKKKLGIILVEVLLAAGLLSVILVPVLHLSVAGLEANFFAGREVKGESLIVEQIEGLRSIRAANWDNLSPGNFYVEVQGGAWQLVETETGFDDGVFTRLIELESVYRDADDLIVPEGTPDSQLDPSTYLATITVSWRSLQDRELVASIYLMRFDDSDTWIQTTQIEFDAGEYEYAESVLTDDGEVELMGGCAENPGDGPLIFLDEFYNTWDIHPSARQDLEESGEMVHEGAIALRLEGFNGADTKLRNGSNTCTLGFERIEAWVYNTAEVEQSFGMHSQWGGTFQELIIPPQEWTFITLPYLEVSGDEEYNMDFLHFKPFDYESTTTLYLDDLTLAGGAGGYYLVGTWASTVLDVGRETVFNRVEFDSVAPGVTAVGFQVATSNNPEGPWLFYGPGGTTSVNDLYLTGTGEGIWLGNNVGRYLRVKGYLLSGDGQETPILQEVRVNYFPGMF